MSLRADYRVVTAWEGGFNASVAITAGAAGLQGWTVSFVADFTIAQIWNAEIVSHEGNRYVLRNLPYNADVPPGGQIEFGFTGGATDDPTPDLILVNDVPAGPLPTLTIADAAVTEGDAGTRILSFAVTLSAAAATTVKVRATTADGTALAGEDYDARAQTLSFAPGETRKVFKVAVSGDLANESSETLRVLLSNPRDALIADGEAHGTIRNDDAPPRISILDATATEGDAGRTDLTFTLRLSKAWRETVEVDWATRNGTALAGEDFLRKVGHLVFAPGETEQHVTIQVRGDTREEADEAFSLVLRNASGGVFADRLATGVIRDDDAPPGGEGFLSTRGNQIVDADGDVVRITGVNWFGMETASFAPHGLWARNWREMMDQMVDLGFNTIRLPFSLEALQPGKAPNGIDLAKNPDLAGLSALGILDRIVDYAGEIGLRIILDNHRSAAGGGPNGNGLWVDGGYTEAQWIAAWTQLAGRYAGNPTVIGADLANEPHNGVWGGGGANDWTAAAERAGNAIHAVNDDWLIFVEGVGQAGGEGYWWGGNLKGAAADPVVLTTPNKVVYSPHDYGNSIYPQTWFSDPDFPANLPEIFDRFWGYLFREGTAPLMLGEFGSRLTDPKDLPWLQKLMAYLGGDFDGDGDRDLAAGLEGISWTWWSWNPNSGDTGGILADDWTTPIQAKLDLLRAQLGDPWG